jgi:hypothetical protein
MSYTSRRQRGRSATAASPGHAVYVTSRCAEMVGVVIAVPARNLFEPRETKVAEESA